MRPASRRKSKWQRAGRRASRRLADPRHKRASRRFASWAGTSPAMRRIGSARICRRSIDEGLSCILGGMGHHVTGMIGNHRQLEAFARERALPSPVPLISDLALLPLRDEEMDTFLPAPLTGWHEEFAYLTDQLMS